MNFLSSTRSVKKSIAPSFTSGSSVKDSAISSTRSVMDTVEPLMRRTSFDLFASVGCVSGSVVGVITGGEAGATLGGKLGAMLGEGLHKMLLKSHADNSETPPSILQTEDTVLRFGHVYLIKDSITKDSQKDLINHWSLGIDFGEVMAVLEGMNYNEKMMPNMFLIETAKMKDSKAVTMYPLTKEEMSRHHDVWESSVFLVRIVAMTRRRELPELRTVRVSLKQLTEVASANSGNKRSYKIGSNDCHGWIIETAKALVPYKV